LGLSLIAACGWLAATYFVRPDALAAITVCPPWVWSVPAFLVLAAASVRRTGGRLLLAAWAAWLLYLPATADTPLAPLRSATATDAASAPAGAAAVRVISLNCGGLSGRSADDVLEFHPQILLLQESPSAQELADLARRLYGDRGQYLWNADASIVADGVVEPLPGHDPQNIHASMARVTLTEGREVAVVSLRLEPAIVRLDFWAPACWKAQAANRRERRRQLREIASSAAAPAGMPLVLGGDFNAPAGDAALRVLSPRLCDSFREAGVGWGNTIVNEFPFARIDQVWIDDHWRAVAVRAQRTVHSDHRMVIADLVLDGDAN